MEPRPLNPVRFNSEDDPLRKLEVQQAIYLRHYLADLGATTVIREGAYFDRDYLSEFSAFYALSTRGYPNTCERLHFFSGEPFDRDYLFRALSSRSGSECSKLRRDYLGFTVIRPIAAAPFGRTVMRWYPDPHSASTPRVTKPSRSYTCHLAGMELNTEGLAWQQQDSAVGACATIALWSMLHSLAFDDHHAIPTTAEITRLANRTASLGARMFPSRGLSIFQVCECIKECGLAPTVLHGNLKREGKDEPGFSRDRFSSALASLLRAGYPVLLIGELETSSEPHPKHAVCVVGFRECASQMPSAGAVELQDCGIEYVYVHDDNLGPSVRFQLVTDQAGNFVRMISSPPNTIHKLELPKTPTASYPAFVPNQIVAAVHEGVRTSPDALCERGIKLGEAICDSYNSLVDSGHISAPQLGLSISTRFMRLTEYLGDELEKLLKKQPTALAATRLQLVEGVPPLSLHIGLVRIGWGQSVLADVLYDTSDSDRNLSAFCSVCFDSKLGEFLAFLREQGFHELGTVVKVQMEELDPVPS